MMIGSDMSPDSSRVSSVNDDSIPNVSGVTLTLIGSIIGVTQSYESYLTQCLDYL